MVETRDAALAEAGDLLIPIGEGAIDPGHVVADLAELVRGATVRTSARTTSPCSSRWAWRSKTSWSRAPPSTRWHERDAPTSSSSAAGIVGCSAAYHLAAAGAGSVLLLDRADAPGPGSTGACAGGFRHQFTTGSTSRCRRRARR